jgi:hypothetical protein
LEHAKSGAQSLKLLDAEKALTRRGDELAQWRRDLPWVRIDKDYRFDTTRARRRWQSSLEGAHNCSPTTSCSVPTLDPSAAPDQHFIFHLRSPFVELDSTRAIALESDIHRHD